MGGVRGRLPGWGLQVGRMRRKRRKREKEQGGEDRENRRSPLMMDGSTYQSERQDTNCRSRNNPGRFKQQVLRNTVGEGVSLALED